MPEREVNETPLLKRLNEQRISAAHARKEYLERAAEGAELSADDNAAFERANNDIDRYGKLIEDEIKRGNEERDYTAAWEAGLKKQGSALRGKEKDGSEPSLAEKMRDDLKASRSGETRNGGAYQEIPVHRTFEAERRDLLAGTSNKGAELVPVTLVASLYEKLFDDAAILSTGPSILRTASGEQLKLPRLTALGNLSQANSRVAEAGPIIEGDPSFDQVALDAYKYAQYTQVSRELVEDGVLDIEELIGRVLGRNIANNVGSDLTLGTGTGQPRGVRTLVPSGNKVSSAAGGLISSETTFDKFFDVIAKLKPGYRRNAKWLINDTEMFTLRKLKMNSQYAWEPNLQGAGMPDRFLGYPILSDPNIPVSAASAGVTVIFGDFSAYFVRMVKDVRIEWSMEFAWVNDLLSVKAVFRADGDAIDDNAFAAFNSTA
jgi:HK97 family phage major capsid protein